MNRQMKRLQLALAMMATILSPAMAQVSPVIPTPQIGPVYQPPYGPGFNGQIIIGPNDGCRNYNCPRTGLQNRPAHRRYYDRYFDVPQPGYSSQQRLRGNQALDPALSAQQRCAAQYRSYRPSDNTFQPYQGPRQPCRL